MTRPSSLRTHDLLGRSRPKFTRGALTVHRDPAELRRVTRALRGGVVRCERKHVQEQTGQKFNRENEVM